MKAYFSILFLMLISGDLFSQEVKLAEADKRYDNFSYIDAISIYEKVAKKGYKSADLFQRLGNSYFFNSDFEKAARSYQSLFELNQEVEPEYYYRYAQSLKSIGDYGKATEMMLLFNQKSTGDLRGKLFLENPDYIEKIKENSVRYSIKDAGVNSEYSDYGSAFFKNQMVFTSARVSGDIFERRMKWNNQAFTNLYSAVLNADSSMTKPQKFNAVINTKFNESSAVFTKDGKTMYFTRNSFTNGKKGKSQNKSIFLKLYKAKLISNQWTNVKELPFCSNEFNTAHPALSPDGKILYFVSDMPGGYGQSDIYKVKINDNGTFGKPQNLGTAVNTEGKETFPFVSDHNEIYFSSDGHPGLGGLDIFTANINNDGSIGKVENVGQPINSPSDDFAFMIDSESRNGFFSSDRPGGKGSDDIYRFYEMRRINCEQLLSGNIIDKETGGFLANSKVILFDNGFNVIEEIHADESGQYSFQVKCKENYYVRASKPGYEIKEMNVLIPDKNGKTTLNIPLEKRSKAFKIGDDVGPMLGMKTIYFDLDKAVILVDAAFELEKLLGLMQQNPTLKIDVRSHTDSRQTKEYNQKLSDKRAAATINWLVQKGIEPKRLSGRGYGESQLVNGCADGVECSEEEHQKNRRSQFIVVEI